MTIVAGMDLGYGSQVKLLLLTISTVNAASSPTDAGAVNWLKAIGYNKL